MLFDDFNANGKQDPDEIGLGGHTVYLDLNNNRVFDAGEPFTLTEQDDPTTATIVETGQYSFLDLRLESITLRTNTERLECDNCRRSLDNPPPALRRTGHNLRRRLSQMKKR